MMSFLKMSLIACFSMGAFFQFQSSRGSVDDLPISRKKESHELIVAVLENDREENRNEANKFKLDGNFSGYEASITFTEGRVTIFRHLDIGEKSDTPVTKEPQDDLTSLLSVRDIKIICQGLESRRFPLKFAMLFEESAVMGSSALPIGKIKMTDDSGEKLVIDILGDGFGVDSNGKQVVFLSAAVSMVVNDAYYKISNKRLPQRLIDVLDGNWYRKKSAEVYFINQN